MSQQALTTYQRSTSAVHHYWQIAKANSLHVEGAQFTATPRKVTQEGQNGALAVCFRNG